MIIDWSIVEGVLKKTDLNCFPLIFEDEGNWNFWRTFSVFQAWSWSNNIPEKYKRPYEWNESKNKYNCRFSFDRVDCIIYSANQIVFKFHERKYPNSTYGKNEFKCILEFAVSSVNFNTEMKERIKERIEERRSDIINEVYQNSIDIQNERILNRISGMVNTQIFLQDLNGKYFGRK